MATFFGEIVQGCSRAFVDENSLNSSKPVYNVIYEDGIDKSKYDYFILMTDDVCTGFASSCFDFEKASLVAVVEETCRDAYSDSIKQRKIAELYKLKQNILLLKCSFSVDPAKANSLLLTISSWLKQSKEIIVFTSKSVQEYKTTKRTDQSESSFCRALKTKSNSSSIACPILESPNTVTGFPAAVISWCQFEDLQCASYIFYYSKQLFIVNSLDVSILLELCRKLKWFEDVAANKSDGDCSNRIYVRHGTHESSNMYM